MWSPSHSRCLNSIITQQDLVDTWRVNIHNPASTHGYNLVQHMASNNREAARFDRIYISSSISSTLIHSNISPVGFTDHHFISIEMVSLPGARFKFCWAFNNKHLRYSFFCQSFNFFWQQWSLKKDHFVTLRQWWEVVEAQIRVFCQQDTSHSTAKIKSAVQELEVDIMRMEEGLPGYSGASVGPLLHEKSLKLSSLLQ